MSSPDLLHPHDSISSPSASIGTEWQPITLTLVEYPKGDLVGKLLAWISLAPLGIGAGFVALILFRRDLHTIVFFLGTLVNECFNMILKHWIKEPRPVSRAQIWTEYGMPSSHSQFMCFFATYVLLFIFIRLHHMNNSNSARLERLVRLLVLAICWTAAFLVCFGRIYLLYHTLNQVLIGAFVGMVMGVLWFLLTHCVLTPYFPMVVTWRISELFLLRDTTLIPNVLWFEYTATRHEARARARKLVSMKSQ
ncbi:dolichyldiphosphatase 1-like [Anopheles ziemanni]|uniref:dolichyldiphosphatase 1-like n=1 Tax=Anopheles coustani TaxID=139045 RepID=UPI00265A7172|nr:dolichyldiphosphatase 1-like [Anopheles coustani]XP_058172053.1 dolichyldiphosphatase 1-like [Anopheles ziemanni]